MDLKKFMKDLIKNINKIYILFYKINNNLI